MLLKIKIMCHYIQFTYKALLKSPATHQDGRRGGRISLAGLVEWGVATEVESAIVCGKSIHSALNSGVLMCTLWGRVRKREPGYRKIIKSNRVRIIDR